MNDAASRHPEVQTMVAFIDGVLPQNEVAAVADHLRGCADCRTVVAETARFEREEERAAQPARPVRWHWLAAAAVITAVAITAPFILSNLKRPAAQLAHLVEAAPREHRSLEGRLSGFPWARLQAPARGAAAPDPADLKLAGAVGDVLEATAGHRTPESLHARGAAYLLIGRHSDAIAALEEAAGTSKDARVWNDLAAARYAFAVENERPSELPLALAEVDRALALDPGAAAAQFNRALILERLGIRDQARKAWQTYLSIDSGSGWAIEARAHLRALEDRSSRFDPKLLDMPAATLVRQFPQEARTWGEGPLLAEWADAEAARSPERASTRLSLVRGIGTSLATANGEHLLADAVAAIDRATGDARAALIDGHRLYRDARIEYSARSSGTAEVKFIRAAALFREGGSAMAEMARYYAAGAAFALNRGAEAHDALSRLRAEIDGRRHRALAAQIQWSLAVAANADGDWGTGARNADAAAAIFQSLGEAKNGATMEGIAADAFDRIGSSDLAWSRRIRTCAALGAMERARFLRSAAMTLDRFGRSDGAAAMIGLAIDDLRHDPAQLVAALTDRARFADHNGDAAGARLGLTAARSAAGDVQDAALREMLDASIGVADAALRRRTEPQTAVAELDRAVALFGKGRLGHLLPDALLERARAHRAAGNPVAAVADYAAALREVETQRDTIGDGDLRLRFLDTAAQIIEEAIDLHLSRGAVSEAFRIADGSRELAGTPATSEPVDPPYLPPGTAVIEYAVLPHATAIFCLSAGHITVETVPVERNALAQRIASLAGRIRGRAPREQIHTDAAALYRLLIAPLQQRLAGVDQIVIVPDRQLHALPFAALYDPSRGEYLVERFAIRFAPSASAAGEIAPGALQPALVIADPPAPPLPRLPASRDEGRRIAAMYGTDLLSGESATRERFITEAKESALIHFAGHADSDARDSWGALLFAAPDRESAILGSSEIARLSLAKRPLVVLAACGTSRGDPVHAAGMSSIARAFLLAGARAVVGTLWEMDDDVAALFFLRLHEDLRAGASPAEAVRAAQLAMIHASDPRLQHPATWAPVASTEHSLRRKP